MPMPCSSVTRICASGGLLLIVTGNTLCPTILAQPPKKNVIATKTASKFLCICSPWLIRGKMGPHTEQRRHRFAQHDPQHQRRHRPPEMEAPISCSRFESHTAAVNRQEKC